MSSSSLIVDDRTYDLDAYAFIVSCEFRSMVKRAPGAPPWHMVAFVPDEHSRKSEYEHIDGMSTMPADERARIIDAVDAYLVAHPQKRATFDGCCYHFP
jgi:hypothetical protein